MFHLVERTRKLTLDFYKEINHQLLSKWKVQMLNCKKV